MDQEVTCDRLDFCTKDVDRRQLQSTVNMSQLPHLIPDTKIKSEEVVKFRFV